ncbi:globin family protein [Anthocerotibacter panamensis]|uniref:CpcA n=1 Tax=Anthocerotibacter panamensis TaxID=2857077 RepID=A0AAJ6N6H0_9CYAN|nr:phycocyanin subunit alpha [Anthocerotibacter panamensis]8IML_A Chain A, CpcA [Anthocerotibacter panamensis]8IML_B Chain B, CpcA [Anthocerotibacter panamensis]8IML_C Chain C, CpcA [Anthocerotibacter panamensis]8IML_D Chain D, CpcA [Anthocerotibacter panamensis]8IML_E Chain E, CpcA [Anthocerotibacter panamensis]8IML_F Chain F, CpcA [Anthocerotibacter panamensis]8IML_N Chain N, CpcA [Anthocerotibacter panamensis]8IML_O Chain O, CpcA [Anthocerotibacter panamensis]8IML_P Chain P, CpcA [Antho
MSRTVITEVIATADSQGRFLNSTELQAAFGRFERAVPAIEAARALTKNQDALVKGAVQAVFKKFPYVTQPGEKGYGDSNQAKCARDIGYYLRFITYSLVASGTGPLDDYVIAGLREVNRAFNLNPLWYIEALNYIKGETGKLLSGQSKTEALLYIDHAINALS